jgi:hypothetical protein
MTTIFRLPLHEDKNEVSSCEMTRFRLRLNARSKTNLSKTQQSHTCVISGAFMDFCDAVRS